MAGLATFNQASHPAKSPTTLPGCAPKMILLPIQLKAAGHQQISAGQNRFCPSSSFQVLTASPRLIESVLFEGFKRATHSASSVVNINVKVHD